MFRMYELPDSLATWNGYQPFTCNTPHKFYSKTRKNVTETGEEMFIFRNFVKRYTLMLQRKSTLGVILYLFPFSSSFSILLYDALYKNIYFCNQEDLL